MALRAIAWVPQTVVLVRGRMGYAYSSVSTNMASTDRNSLMVNGNYQTDDVELYMRGMFAKTVHLVDMPAAAK